MFVATIYFVITACTLHHTTAAVPKYSDIDPRIVFPGPIKEKDIKTRIGVSNGTDPCAGQTFCTVKPNNYPEHIFNALFKGKIKDPFRPSYVSIDDRFESTYDADNCETRVVYEPLYQVRSDPQSEWQTVVQAPEENFVQMVRIEVCEKFDVPCFTKLRAPIDYVTSCRQLEGVWEFLVYDKYNNTTKTSKTLLPSCCSCFYKHV